MYVLVQARCRVEWIYIVRQETISSISSWAQEPNECNERRTGHCQLPPLQLFASAGTGGAHAAFEMFVVVVP